MEHSSHLPDWEEYKAMSREEKAAAQLQSNPRSRCMIFDSFEPGNPKLRLTRLKSGEIQAEILRPESPAASGAGGFHPAGRRPLGVSLRRGERSPVPLGRPAA